jgi:hypothetical protein
MPHQICHAHCPSGGGGLAVVAAAGVAVVGTGATIVAYLDDLVMIAGVTVAVLLAAGIWYLLHILRRDKFVSHRAEIYSQAVYGESRLLAFDVTAPTGSRRNQALVAKQRQALTDGAQRNPELLGKLALARQPVRVRAIRDERPEDRG